MNSDFNDLTPQERRETLGGDEYVIREASEAAAVAYKNAQMRAAKMSDGKLTGFDGYADADLVLAVACLHPVDKSTGQVKVDQSGDPWTLAERTVKRWPHRVVKRIVAVVKELSPDLEDKETRETLVKQRDNLQKKIDELDAEAAKGKDDPAKNP